MRRNPSPLSDAHERISPLAKLPVFWNLQGKRTVIAGECIGQTAEIGAHCAH
jgi:uroporphyrin-III C-methyltransferase / precorrin-2 dehydrogenase / sirohydrochlorin ferrochelatase